MKFLYTWLNPISLGLWSHGLTIMMGNDSDMECDDGKDMNKL